MNTRALFWAKEEQAGGEQLPANSRSPRIAPPVAWAARVSTRRLLVPGSVRPSYGSGRRVFAAAGRTDSTLSPGTDVRGASERGARVGLDMCRLKTAQV